MSDKEYQEFFECDDLALCKNFDSFGEDYDSEKVFEIIKEDGYPYFRIIDSVDLKRIREYIDSRFEKKSAAPSTVFCNAAVFNENLDLLKFLTSKGCPWDKDICRYTINGNNSQNSEILEWLIENGCEKTSASIIWAIFHVDILALEILYENHFPWPSEQEQIDYFDETIDDMILEIEDDEFLEVLKNIRESWENGSFDVHFYDLPKPAKR